MRSPWDKKPATYDDLSKLPDDVVGQIIDGELIASPRPATDHSVVSSVLGGELMGPFQHGRGGGPGGWWILDEPELHLGTDVVVPDLAGWRKSRMPMVPRATHLELAPDWICEVLSPSTAAIDRVKKRHVYARAGVEFLWYVDPAGKTLEALQLRESTWVDAGTFAGDERVRVPPFEELELDLGLLWIPEET